MHQIRYFLAVARVLNFTRAAEECHVAQPSLTRAIKLLEAELGSDLFRRERNLTHLTDFGHRMLPLLQQCHDSALSAKKLAGSFRTGEAAAVAIALSHTVPMTLLVEPLGELVRAFPKIELRFIRGRPAQVAESLKKGEASLAIAGPLPESWERLDGWPLFSEPFEALLHRDHPLASRPGLNLRDLAGHRLLARPYCEHHAAFDDAVKDIAGCGKTRHEVGSDDDLVRLVEIDLGVGIVPRSLLAPAHLGRLPIQDLPIERSLSLYAVSGRERSPATTVLMKLLRARDWTGPVLAAAA